jgi:hypothetical protein
MTFCDLDSYCFEFGDHCDLNCVIWPQNNNFLLHVLLWSLEIILAAKILNIQGIPCQFFQNAILKNSMLLARYNLHSVSRKAALF